ncbi:G-type lectin S-receptor-like serine/threonine-protein kinase SD2-5 [Pistacia vera]|uniref:G-type lectin S-receptor-like serine/threonine-protein kinase SD2-5 n=1 Tax=Pistacia vera TaxID=55513 RepID=UPI001262CC6F|nr:G-type lectin S-receptor-like serine/threonine-protein kinase SD2-5 [Pistacia vera]
MANSVAWSSYTTVQKVSSMELQDSGNLVLLGEDGSVVWQSYSHPTNTLLLGQEFSEGIRLTKFSQQQQHDCYQTPQTYWSLANDSQKTNSSVGGKVHSAYLESNAWNFYDQNKKLLCQFVFTKNTNPNATWAAILGSDGTITFSDLHKGNQVASEAIKIPQNSCSNPEHCSPYYVCSLEGWCKCPWLANKLAFVTAPALHCSLDFEGYISYVKIVNGTSDGSGNKGKKTLLIVFMVIASIIVISVLLYLGLWYRRKKKSMKFSQENFEEDTFLDSFSGMPTRFSYNDLSKATKSFSTKLEGFGHGKKEFGAEVSTIGMVHHLHLVKLRGFCAEGSHRLLVYEYMSNGCLNKWIFKINEESQLLSWNTRLNIALGTAMGLAYLHSECELKIVHCDIKPENVLLDDNFNAKVSDFSLAKLMTHEESRVYTALRGTRGYLAPEWIKDNPISEKTDVYSYGVVLLEIISGRRSYDPGDDSEKSHFPSYAFKTLEGGKLSEILDSRLDIDENHESVVNLIKVALWCIQDVMHLRPPMTKVVQMLKGLCAVPQPPTPSQLNSQGCSSFVKWSSEEGTVLELVDADNGGVISEVQISGPR